MEWVVFVVLLGILGLIFSPYIPFKNTPKSFAVVSGSMEPAIHTGSVAFVRTIDPKTIKKGDIIAFTSPSNSKDTILHRVDFIKTTDPLTFSTKGDANNSPDVWDVMDVGVKGVYFGAIPFLGYIADFVKKPLGFGIVVGIPALLFIISQLFSIKKAINEEVDRKVAKVLEPKKKTKTTPIDMKSLILSIALFSSLAGLSTLQAIKASFFSTVTVSGISLSVVDFIPPSAPANLRWSDPNVACGGSTNGYTLTAVWDASTSHGSKTIDHYEYESFNPPGGWMWGPVNVSATQRAGAFTVGVGTYGFRVRAVDSLGYASDWTSVDFDTSCQIIVDWTAPTVHLVFPAPGPSATSFQVIFSEDVKSNEASDPANYFLNNWPGYGGSGNLTGHADISYDSTSHTATVTFTTPGWYISPEQQWGVQNIHDLAGNLQSVNHYTEYSTPMVKPITTDSGMDSNWHNSPVTVNFSCTDINGSGCKATYYTTDGSDPTTTSPSGNSVTLNTDGIFTIKYFSTDNAGNVEDVKTVANTVKIDKTAPVVHLTDPAAAFVSGTVAIEGTVTDANPDHYYLVILNSSNAVIAGPNVVTDKTSFTNKLLFSWDTTTNVTDGNYTIDLEARDAAGNKDSGSVTTKTVTVDNTVPVSVITGPVSSNSNNQADVSVPSWDGKIEGSASDNLSGVDRVEISIQKDSDEFWSGTDWIPGSESSTRVLATGTTTWSYQILGTVSPGSYKITSHAIDKVGNVENSATIEFDNEDSVTSPESVDTSTPTPIASPFSQITLSVDQKYVSFVVNNIGNFKSLSYQLTYDTSTVPQGVIGNTDITGGSSSYFSGNIPLGMCSTGGICVFSQENKNFQLSVSLIDQNGVTTVIITSL